MQEKKNKLKEKHCKKLLYLHTLIFSFLKDKKKSLQKQIFSKQVSLQVLHPFDFHVSIHLGFV